MNLEKECFSDIPCCALANLDRVVVVPERKKHLQDGQAQHDDRRSGDHLHIILVDALVNDTLDQARDGQVNENHENQQQEGEDRIRPIGAQEGKELGDVLHTSSLREVFEFLAFA